MTEKRKIKQRQKRKKNPLKSPLHYSLRQPFVLFCFCLILRFSVICYFHYLWYQLLASFTVLMTLRYYFISYFMTVHLVSHLSLSSIILIISTLIISIFDCLNYTSLLLHLIITHHVNKFYNNCVIKICLRQLLWFI